MSEHAPLTEAERASLDESLEDSGCYGFLGDHPPLYAAVERILAARTSTATADTGLRERVEALADRWERQGGPDSMMRKTGEQYAAELRDAAAAPRLDLRARVEALERALRYVAQPTMGLPPGVDPETFAREQADPDMARLALTTCIRTARAALNATAAPTTDTGARDE